MLTAKEQKILEALEPQAQAQQVEIVTIEIVGAKKAPTIRVYIDTPEGVGFDELASAQAWINEIVDRLDPFPGAYSLEVSSPGIDRPLRTPDHFARFAGEKVSLQTTAPIDGRKNWTGKLIGFFDGSVRILADGSDTETDIAFDVIKRAQVKGTVDFGS